MQYKIVNGTHLTDAHLDEIARLIFDTGYFFESAKDNKLNLPPYEFQKQISVLPAKKHYRVLFDAVDNLLGFHLSLNSILTAELSHYYQFYADSPSNREVIGMVDELCASEYKDSDLFIHFSCMHAAARAQGLFKLLRYDQVRQAELNACDRFFAIVWATNSDSLQVFKKYGAIVNKVLDLRHTAYKNQIYNMITPLPAAKTHLGQYTYIPKICSFE